jgi:hypothetical protein
MTKPVLSIVAGGKSGGPVSAIDGAGSGGNNGSMPPEFEKRLASVEGDVKALTKDVAEIKGRLTQMPTTFQMIFAFAGISVGLVGLVFTIARAMK